MPRLVTVQAELQIPQPVLSLAQLSGLQYQSAAEPGSQADITLEAEIAHAHPP